MEGLFLAPAWVALNPYFATRPITAALFGLTVGVWVVLELRQSRRHRRGAAQRDHGSHGVLRICVAAALVINAISPSRWPGATIGGQPAPFAVGLALAWSGIGLRWWAFHTLGQYFTFWVRTSTDQPIITRGPYRVLRHPGYSGVELILLGLGLLYGTWIGLAAMAVLPMLGLVNRIRVEERALTADLDDDYQAFAVTRKRMIPHIW